MFAAYCLAAQDVTAPIALPDLDGQAAVEQQSAATGGFAHNAQSASQGTQDVTASILQVKDGGADTGDRAGHVKNTADGLIVQANQLAGEVEVFPDAVFGLCALQVIRRSTLWTGDGAAGKADLVQGIDIGYAPALRQIGIAANIPIGRKRLGTKGYLIVIVSQFAFAAIEIGNAPQIPAAFKHVADAKAEIAFPAVAVIKASAQIEEQHAVIILKQRDE